MHRMPRLTGSSIEDGRTQLRRLGFRGGIRFPRSSRTGRRAIVVRQSPLPGVLIDDDVNIELAAVSRRLGAKLRGWRCVDIVEHQRQVDVRRLAAAFRKALRTPAVAFAGGENGTFTLPNFAGDTVADVQLWAEARGISVLVFTSPSQAFPDEGLPPEGNEEKGVVENHPSTPAGSEVSAGQGIGVVT